MHYLQGGGHGSERRCVLSVCCLLGAYGGFPQSLLDQEDARLRQLHTSCADLKELNRVSENAHKQYVRSRGQPAPESVKRAKQLPDSLPVHSLFEGLCSPGAMAQCRVLDSLKQYKPAQVCVCVRACVRVRVWKGGWCFEWCFL